MWVPAYMKHLFWAGMKTTQRSESINSFFDGYVHKTTKTDQDAAMRKALHNAMPESVHRWCIWHIMMKFGKKLGSYANYKDVKEALT